MPQDVGDILHRRAGAQKPTGHAVPQNMNPCAGPSASSIACQNRALDDALLDRLVIRGDVADKYGPARGLETFIRDHMAGYRHLFAIENDAVHISVNVPVRFAHTFRDAVLGRRGTPNELVFTAVSHVLESANAEAA